MSSDHLGDVAGYQLSLDGRDEPLTGWDVHLQSDCPAGERRRWRWVARRAGRLPRRGRWCSSPVTAALRAFRLGATGLPWPHEQPQ